MGVDFYNCDACGQVRHPDNLSSCSNCCGVYYCADLGCASENIGRTEEGGDSYCHECLPKCSLCNEPAHIDNAIECDTWIHTADSCKWDFGPLTRGLLDNEVCLSCVEEDPGGLGECGIEGCRDTAVVQLDSPCGCGHTKGCWTHFEQHVCDRLGESINRLADSGDPEAVREVLNYIRRKNGNRVVEKALERVHLL